MSLYWIIVAVVNLLLGVAAGHYLGHWLRAGEPMPRFPRRKAGSLPSPSFPPDKGTSSPEAEPAGQQKTILETPSETTNTASTPPEVAPAEKPADGSQDLLPEMAQQFQAASSPEALILCAADVLEAHSRNYLQGLAQLDSRTRQLQQQFEPGDFEQVLSQLEQLSNQWLAAQQTALDQMTSHAAAKGVQEIDQLEHLLLEQTAQIETTMNNLRMALAAEEVGGAAARLLHEIKALVGRMHQLQEQTLQVAAKVFDPQRGSGPEDQLRQDGFTGLPSRLGIAALVDQWRVEDPHRMRQASVVLVGVDQMNQWNEQLGVEVGDWLLKCLAQALPQAIRQNRGFDRVGYYGGDRFLVFLGDASPHNASVVAERIRQSVEGGQFVGRGDQVPLRVSCGVVECLPGDSFQATCTRAEQTLQHAKDHGRNCTAVHDGTQASVIQAPPLKIVPWSFEFSQVPQPVPSA